MDEKITQEPLSRLSTNMWAFRTLIAGIKLNIFEYIKEESTAKKVAEKMNVDTDPVERLLNAFVSMELIEKKNNSYVNLPISNKYLVKGSLNYYGDFALMFEKFDDNWKQLDQSILTNKVIDNYDHMGKLAKPLFTRAMHNNAEAPANKLSEIIDFSEKKHLLDIGAGAGTFSIILTNKYPNLKATTIEQEEVCKVIHEYIEKLGNSEKITVVSGDFFELDFPEHDVALFGHIFHSNSIEQNKMLLKKVYDKLANNGMVIITEFLLNEDRTGPLFSTLFALNMLNQTKNGNAYTFSQLEEWLSEAGFKSIRKEQLVGPHTAIIAEK